MSLDETNDSKIEINVKDPSTEASLIEDKIILNQESDRSYYRSSYDNPCRRRGVEVEVQTEVEVPVDDKDKDIESELKVLVHSPTLSTEVPLMSSSSSPSSSTSQQPLTPLLQQERTSTSFNKQENQQSSNKVLLDETKNNINKATNKSTQPISRLHSEN